MGDKNDSTIRCSMLDVDTFQAVAVVDRSTRKRARHPVSKEVESEPANRRKKVQTVRRQVRSGTYDADGLFDEAVDRLLERIFGGDL